MTEKKFIIITSIFPPTAAVKAFAQREDWHVVVVGDKKTPFDWSYENVTYLGAEEQVNLDFHLTKLLPWNHYCRKMVGYLYAMQQGATIIYDTDDDNEPKEIWPKLPAFEGSYPTLSDKKFINIYRHFTDLPVWPRGFPLADVLDATPPKESEETARVGVWQFLADEDPDVDAIYRLVDNTRVTFAPDRRYVLQKGSICPFNSQNTAFRKAVFPLLYLPAFVTFRFTDILRGLVAQPLLWADGYQLGFAEATVVQARNPHDFIRDFEQEIPVYLHGPKVVDIISEALSDLPQATSITDRLTAAYGALHDHGIVTEEEVALLAAWLADIAEVGAA